MLLKHERLRNMRLLCCPTQCFENEHYQVCMTWRRSLQPKRPQWQDYILSGSCLALIIAHMPSIGAIRCLHQPQAS